MNGWRTGSQCAQVNSKRGGGTSPETFLKRESVEWGDALFQNSLRRIAIRLVPPRLQERGICGEYGG
jgi:hypothetical protein